MSPVSDNQAPAIWTRGLCRALVASAVLVLLGAILVLLGNAVMEGVSVVLLLSGFVVFISVDMTVVRRASPGMSPLLRMARGHSIRREAYRWADIRAGLHGR